MKMLDSASFVGAHSEAQFITYALASGWEVSLPFNKAAPYDYVIRRAPREPWETVQVKRAYYAATGKTKTLAVGLRRSGSKKSTSQPYKEGDFDWLFAFHEHGMWFMPWELVRKKRSSVQVGSPLYDLWRVDKQAAS